MTSAAAWRTADVVDAATWTVELTDAEIKAEYATARDIAFQRLSAMGRVRLTARPGQNLAAALIYLHRDIGAMLGTGGTLIIEPPGGGRIVYAGAACHGAERDNNGVMTRVSFTFIGMTVGAHDDFVDWLAHVGNGLMREQRATVPKSSSAPITRGTMSNGQARSIPRPSEYTVNVMPMPTMSSSARS